ncbi:MAG: hypothetical protein HY673_21280 [Chloroflexi bacterium]|nr:hypothetical protein [Chloroflexota bacterium]
MVTESYILKRIEILQEELERLKKAVAQRPAENPVSLQGIWKGVHFTDEEIEEAKKSWVRE